MSANTLILCPTARLVRSIQYDLARQHQTHAETVWQTPSICTLTQWLSQTIETTLLSGTMEVENPPGLLNSLNERLLWEDVISSSLSKHQLGDLFDISGLANAAIEANRHMVAWKLHVPREHAAEETRHFLHWQRIFRQRCDEMNRLESLRYMDWQLTLIRKLDASQLPKEIAFAGFDQTAPQETELREILTRHGLQVSEYPCTLPETGQAQHVLLQDQDTETRAVVAWAKQILQDNPQARLAIVVPQLTETRNRLADLLDDVLYPHSVRPSLSDIPRHYNFSLGTPLVEQPIVQAALNLLRLFSAHPLRQEDVSRLLLSPFWSANVQEADARAQLDATMREKMPIQFSRASLLTFIEQQHAQGLPIAQLLAALNACQLATPNTRHLPSAWVTHIEAMLAALQWPGERNITSLEFQTINAWQKALQQFAQLDTLGNKHTLSQAVRILQQVCSEQVFQPETKGEPSIQILGIMEALSAPMDALWVMHMNDQIWPPPARPNPLLPAFIQRAAAVPGADNTVQAAFASTIHRRLLHSANHIIFSSSMTEGDSQLRPSPLMQTISKTILPPPVAETLAEQLSHAGNADLTFITDHIAPAVAPGEHVSGGTGLFKAQAVCPAWAFYQYRLGAKALKSPSSGLDTLTRGSLVHGVLENFWQLSIGKFRHFADLRDMTPATLATAIEAAVAHTLQAFAAETPLSPALLALEQERLFNLAQGWLTFERERGIAFRIIGCEQKEKTHIHGLEITLMVDRIHQLENSGGWELVDYKTGQIPKTKSWGEDRITEPQLPIYACFFSDGSAQISGVQFGMVKIAEHAFKGISAADFNDEKSRNTLVKQFSNWEDLLKHWRSSIEAIALEIISGEAGVRYADEEELNYCEVKPILRLPERQLQFERFNNQPNL